MSLNNQNKDLMEKIIKIHNKMKEKEEIYVKKFGQIENSLNEHKNNVKATLNEINWIKDNAYVYSKESKATVKALEINILEAEKTLNRLQESISINKQYEAQRLQSLRDNKKLLDEVIWKDSYQMF